MRVDSTVESVVERVAAIDIGKEEVVVCVRVPGPVEGQRSSEIRTFPTMTADLLELSQWLTDWGVRRVVMEATGDYWKPVFYVLEGSFEETWLVNAHDVKHVPGRPKTDRLDALLLVVNPTYLNKLFEHPVGWMMLIVAGGLLSVGAFWLHKTVQIKF